MRFVAHLTDHIRVRPATGASAWKLTRQKLDDRRTPAGLRARQLQARDMLRGDLEGEELERYLEERVLTTTLDKAIAGGRGNSIYPLTLGLACPIETMTSVAARMDAARFGFEFLRASPRQADLIILSGRVSIKIAPVIRRLYMTRCSTPSGRSPWVPAAPRLECSTTRHSSRRTSSCRLMSTSRGARRVRKHSRTGSFSSATRFTATTRRLAPALRRAGDRGNGRRATPSRHTNLIGGHQAISSQCERTPPGEFPSTPPDERRGL
jgi:hypothetical protein